MQARLVRETSAGVRLPTRWSHNRTPTLQPSLRMSALDDARRDREVGSRNSTLDTTRIDDVRIGAVRPLITPPLLQERVPVSDEALDLVERSRVAAAAILHRTR